MSAAEKSYDEIVDLFARGGGAGAVLAFRPSAEAKARVQELLERSKRDGLSVDEQAELDRFGELEHLMQLVKVRARRFAT
jgi:Holliday junction resolvase